LDVVAPERLTMAEITKLSVGKVLDMLRSSNAPKQTRLAGLDEKIKEQDEQIRRLRAQRIRLEAGLPPPVDNE
jgi:septal ring factor EnvC (AmiA/AmiB activator)